MARQDLGPVRRFLVGWLPLLFVLVFVVALVASMIDTAGGR